MTITHRVQLPDLLIYFNLPLIGIELGSAEGYSASDFMKAGLEKLYMVDMWGNIPTQSGDGNMPDSWHHKNYEDAVERLKPYGDKVTFLRGLTKDMAQYVPDNSVGMVYIDALHTEQGVRDDINNYWSKLVKGGCMAFHDFLSPEYGVKEAVYKFADQNGLQVHFIPENKTEDAGAYFFKP